ncbi:ATP-binding protein [uncultured Flavobacterium sp.]|uniref:sensor histidine kinase n=1 Tax=uncultured Flavobacterium sp. TaxID=165435 RepID=UPI0025D17DE1|nr:ATP-binding protein [uncultured Flavobacterium sp.]
MNSVAFGIVIGFLFVSLMVLFCVLLVKLYIRRVRNYAIALYQKDMDSQKALNAAILETQEQVLAGIAQELHDDAGQQLAYINFQVENLKLDSPQMKEKLSPLSESVGALSQSVRSISHALNSQMLVQQDIFKAIEAEVRRLEKNCPISLKVSGKFREREFSPEEKIMVYRIFQEMVANCCKHASASEIAVSLLRGKNFELRIADNGRGFDLALLDEKATMGFANMKRRAEVIGFALDISSAIGKGTLVRLYEKNTD